MVEKNDKTANLSNLIELASRPELDVLFPIVHGNLGEDGVLQGLFRLIDKPFVGVDVLAAAVTMDKEFTKILAQRAGVPVAKWVSIKRYEYEDAKNQKLSYDWVSGQLGTSNLFVKPSNQGSSVGITHVTDDSNYAEALAEAFKYDDKVLVEEGIVGTEVETAVLGNDHPVVSGVGRIINADNTWYSYENKYSTESTTTLQIPAQIPAETAEKVQENALKIYQSLSAAAWPGLTPCLEKATGKSSSTN
jgi:D-alanine-D-alanine ligase